MGRIKKEMDLLSDLNEFYTRYNIIKSSTSSLATNFDISSYTKDTETELLGNPLNNYSFS